MNIKLFTAFQSFTDNINYIILEAEENVHQLRDEEGAQSCGRTPSK